MVSKSLVALCCAAVLAAASVLGDAGVAESQVPQVAVPSSAVFVERFQDTVWDTRWVTGDQKHAAGTWDVTAGLLEYFLPGELGLVVQQAAQRHSIVSSLEKPFKPEEGFFISYEVRFHKPLECGGAYLKLVTSEENEDFIPGSFFSGTPYSIMFGPDRCGATDKVHFIFRHKNPVTGEIEEKHATNMPMIKNDRFSHVYSLGVYSNNTFAVYIDGDLEKEGSLLTDFEPPVNPPKMIDDPSDVKPVDWVDQAQIPDPSAVKPDDWDESAPEYIVDETATKPDDWPDLPEKIPDPEAEEPEDWDDETDGEWEAPLIDNPTCGSRCGEWKPPMIPNPAYKGKWEAPLIDNPEYKGVWKPRQVENPQFFEDNEPHKIMPVTAVGFELWTMQNDIQFDNIFVGSSVPEGLDFARQTWKPKFDAEKLQFKDVPDTEPIMQGDEGIPQWLKFLQPVLDNPIPVGVAVSVGVLTLLLYLWRRSSDNLEQQAKIAKEHLAPLNEEREEESEEQNDEDEEEEQKEESAGDDEQAVNDDDVADENVADSE